MTTRVGPQRAAGPDEQPVGVSHGRVNRPVAGMSTNRIAVTGRL